MIMNKSDVRKTMISLRKNLSVKEVEKNSEMIFENIKSTKILDYDNFLVYLDFKNEVKTDALIRFLTENNRVVYVPKCDITTCTFVPVVYDDEYSLNKYGIKEPKQIPNADAKVDCVIVPGVAFDTKGNRIGFGAGYYDKFLNASRHVFKIGLCYEFQLCNEIPACEFDIPMDVVITEKMVIYTK